MSRSPPSNRSSAPRPGERVVLRNDGEHDATVRVLLRRGDDSRAETVSLTPGETAQVEPPARTGDVTLQVHAEGTTAVATFTADAPAPLVAVRDGALLVVRD